mmetsp:Transcript_55343/g.139920  ORF Transcript_55343/g.139920 Transcript_55343/m.139920 type:complete len:86 (-) Transcript_55343:962-1219(-)
MHEHTRRHSREAALACRLVLRDVCRTEPDQSFAVSEPGPVMHMCTAGSADPPVHIGMCWVLKLTTKGCNHHSRATFGSLLAWSLH